MLIVIYFGIFSIPNLGFPEACFAQETKQNTLNLTLRLKPSYLTQTFLSTSGTAVPIFLRPWRTQARLDQNLFLPREFLRTGGKVEGGEEEEEEKRKKKVGENNGQLRFRPPPRVAHASHLDQ